MPNLRHASASDTRANIATVIAIAGMLATAAGVVFAVGKYAAAADRVERIEAAQNQQGVDIVRAKLQAEGAYAATQRVEAKVDKQDGKLDHINDVLTQIRITGRR